MADLSCSNISQLVDSKGERMAKRSSIGSIAGKRLTDITNSQSQSKLGATQEKYPQISQYSEDFIDQILKERAALLKFIEERDKIIELSGNELRSLRMNYQKLQLQNWNLVQSNSRILAELNLGREKLKALQHEVALNGALLKAKNSELQREADTNCQSTGSQIKEEEKVEAECLENTSLNDSKPCKRTRRRAARSQSMGPSTTHQIEKENVNSKSYCLRRQSARFTSLEQGPAENLFEIEGINFQNIQPHDEKSRQENETQVPHGSSIGRPLRKAVTKVQSYKQLPVNVRMCRREK